MGSFHENKKEKRRKKRNKRKKKKKKVDEILGGENLKNSARKTMKFGRIPKKCK